MTNVESNSSRDEWPAITRFWRRQFQSVPIWKQSFFDICEVAVKPRRSKIRPSPFARIACLLVCLTCPPIQSMGHPTPNEILEKYEHSLSVLQDRVIFKSVTEYFFEGDFPPDAFPARQVLIGDHRRDHDRLDLTIVRKSFDSINDDEPSDYDKRREMVTHYHMGWEIDIAGG